MLQTARRNSYPAANGGSRKSDKAMQEKEDDKMKEVVAPESSLAASLSTMNLDISNSTNDNPDPVSQDGEKAQVTVEEVTIKKKKVVTLDKKEHMGFSFIRL